MKNTDLGVLFVLALSVCAVAQEAKVSNRALDTKATAAQPGSLPSHRAGSSILFYGGDTTVDDPNDQGLPNGNSLLIPTTETLVPIIVPATGHYVATAVFFNVIATLDTFDPATGTYEIRTGISDGKPGTLVARGSGVLTAIPTGRSPFGYTEYTATVEFAKPLIATPGVTYWINESPQCTNSGDANCQEQFFLDNTTKLTNGVDATAQPANQLFFNSAYYGFYYTSWCDSSLGQNLAQCGRGSWGLLQ